MEKYRIVSEHPSNKKLEATGWKVQKKFLFWWRYVQLVDNGKGKDLTFNSFKEAEDYIVSNYFTWGHVTKPYPNEYHYGQYNYWL